MPEQHIQLLKAVGLPEDKITALEAMKPDDLKEWKPDEIAGLIKGALKTQLENDPDFLASIPEDKVPQGIQKKIEKGQYARFQNELTDYAIKTLGLKPEDITEEDKKSIRGLVGKIANTHLAKNNGADGLKNLQQQLADAQAAVETMKTEHTTNLAKELEAVNGKHTSKLIKVIARTELQSLEGVQLSVGAAYLSDPVLSAMSSKYTIVLNDDDTLDLKQKDNPKLDVIEKGKNVTFNEAMKQIVLDKKLGTEVKPDDPEEKKKKKIIIGADGHGQDTSEVVPSYIADKINNKIAEEK